MSLVFYRLCSKFVVIPIGFCQVTWTTFLHKWLIILRFLTFHKTTSHLLCSNLIGISLGTSLIRRCSTFLSNWRIRTNTLRKRPVEVLKSILATIDDTSQTPYSPHYSIPWSRPYFVDVLRNNHLTLVALIAFQGSINQESSSSLEVVIPLRSLHKMPIWYR